ncbi:MAG: CheR family methyltransferase [Verrucomicrobiota bacterium]
MVTSGQLDRTRRLALRLAGIELFERHREVLDRRLCRVGIRDEAGFDALLDAVDMGDENASRRLIGLLTTNFSGFFRHPRHFELAAEHALWAAHRRGEARLWSAAAATGEEPYSLAMSLIEVFRRDDPPVTLLATDIDEAALLFARRGEYGELSLEALPVGLRARFFEPAATAKRWRTHVDLHRLVTFRALNLTDLEWPPAGLFDVVFCRNVLMYLEAGHRYSVLERLASVLAPDGRLILDPAEHLGKAAHLFGPGTNGVYPGRPRATPRADRFRG